MSGHRKRYLQTPLPRPPPPRNMSKEERRAYYYGFEDDVVDPAFAHEEHQQNSYPSTSWPQTPGHLGMRAPDSELDPQIYSDLRSDPPPIINTTGAYEGYEDKVPDVVRSNDVPQVEFDSEAKQGTYKDWEWTVVQRHLPFPQGKGSKPRLEALEMDLRREAQSLGIPREHHSPEALRARHRRMQFTPEEKARSKELAKAYRAADSVGRLRKNAKSRGDYEEVARIDEEREREWMAVMPEDAIRRRQKRREHYERTFHPTETSSPNVRRAETPAASSALGPPQYVEEGSSFVSSYANDSMGTSASNSYPGLDFYPD